MLYTSITNINDTLAKLVIRERENMEYITINRPVSIKLMKEVILFDRGVPYNEQHTFSDLGTAYKASMHSLNSKARAR